jgi:hypothetical protein
MPAADQGTSLPFAEMGRFCLVLFSVKALISPTKNHMQEELVHYFSFGRREHRNVPGTHLKNRQGTKDF